MVSPDLCSYQMNYVHRDESLYVYVVYVRLRWHLSFDDKFTTFFLLTVCSKKNMLIFINVKRVTFFK